MRGPIRIPASQELVVIPELAAEAKLVVAVEGPDGSGKSSLIRFLEELCAQHGRPITRIGRRGPHATPAVARISRLLEGEDGALPPMAAALLRTAREELRAEVAAAAPAGVVVLNRFVLTALALIREAGPDAEAFVPLLGDTAERAGLCATVFVRCPFEVAWERLRARDRGRPVRDRRGREVLERLAVLLDEEFDRGRLTAEQWLVDNAGEPAAAEEQLAGYLLPYLRDGRPQWAGGLR
jgi:thymidylate kinase